jgi:hypothetical protein
MKKLIFSILAIVGLSFSAQAAEPPASFKPQTLLSIYSLAATITNSATSNYTATISVRGANKVGIGQTFQLNGAGTGGNILKIAKSSDGTVFETTPSILITNASAGTTATYYFNEVTVSGCAAIRLTSVVNGSAAALTNVLITAFPTP